MKEGPDHNPCFTASVVVKGVTFDTTLHSNNIKDAQNDAAKLAVDHFIASGTNSIIWSFLFKDLILA